MFRLRNYRHQKDARAPPGVWSGIGRMRGRCPPRGRWSGKGGRVMSACACWDVWSERSLNSACDDIGHWSLHVHSGAVIYLHSALLYI